MSEFDPRIAVMGGGTGSFTLLQEIKELTPNVSAIVNMSDNGGSTGVLRDELGVLPPGDARQCLVALSGDPEIRDLFDYRFGEGRFAGQSLGNIIISGLELKHDNNFAKAIKVASRILNIVGQVVPVTLGNHNLVMDDGEERIVGENQIGQRRIASRNARVSLEPYAVINPEADTAIRQADLVVIAPGNLYGSLLPVLAVDGVPQAIQETDAKVVSVTNLVTKPGQTDGWHAVDYAKEMEKYLGLDAIDYILYNDQPPAKDLLEKYAAEGEYPVEVSLERFSEVTARAIGAALVSSEITVQDPNDKVIRRTLIRHDAKKVSEQLMEMLNN